MAHYYRHVDPPAPPGAFSQGLGGFNGFDGGLGQQTEALLANQALQTLSNTPSVESLAKAVSDAASGDTKNLADLSKQIGEETIKFQVITQIQDPAQQAKFLQDLEAGKQQISNSNNKNKDSSNLMMWGLGLGALAIGGYFALNYFKGRASAPAIEEAEL